MGRNIYFTNQEILQILTYIEEAVDILGEGENTWEQTEKDMKNGLGSALRKLYKGRNGEKKLCKIQNKKSKEKIIGGNCIDLFFKCIIYIYNFIVCF